MNECKGPTTEASIEGMIEALKHGKIKQCICDHGSQFISNIGGDSRFVEFLEKHGINTRIKEFYSKIKKSSLYGIMK